MNAVPGQGFTGRAPWRLVWLPGAAMRAQDVVDQGFDRQAQAAGLDLDLVAVDLQAQRLDGVDQLQALVDQHLRPVRAQGTRVWLAGISLGGWQSVLCARRWPEAVDGLCLLSPYPGERSVWRRIELAGGLDTWTPPAVPDDPVLETWAWWQQPPPDLPVWMGYGVRDRFVDGMARMASRLPRSSVHTLDGDHDWACWQGLWQAFVAHARAGGSEVAP
ncbi:MAG: hypothetical protein KF871_08515 [Hydrogenophaga sp.]|uniref:alpha/beta hydrolase-fold protein n=1 Tax=Hydrogenophaga sp. TaxID=1904254 RepID=UPI001DE6AAB3|nr:alpha/beta hydrolase-fold protein [Hydrogenophaga sp.]MBX3609928.1 hypothetical protein [Hydrogenophaga sp.]